VCTGTPVQYEQTVRAQGTPYQSLVEWQRGRGEQHDSRGEREGGARAPALQRRSILRLIVNIINEWLSCGRHLTHSH